MGRETTAIIVVATGLLATLLHLAVLGSNLNHDIEANLKRARQMLRKGDMEILREGSPDDAPPPPNTRTWTQVWCILLGLVAVLVPLAVPAIRIANNWQKNDDLTPAIVGPGDTVRAKFADSINCVDGKWAGTVKVVRVENEAEIGFPVTVQARGDDDTWKGKIYVKGGAKHIRPKLWVDLTFPDDDRLADKKLRIFVEMEVSYPFAVDFQTFDTASKSVSTTVDVQLTSPHAARTSKRVFWGSMIACFVLLFIASVVMVQYHAFELEKLSKLPKVEVDDEDDEDVDEDEEESDEDDEPPDSSRKRPRRK
jgi:hypothetical protein